MDIKEKVQRITIMASGRKLQVEVTSEDTVADVQAALCLGKGARLKFGGVDLSGKLTLRQVGIENGATLMLVGADAPSGDGPWQSKHHPSQVLSDAKECRPSLDECTKEVQHFHCFALQYRWQSHRLSNAV